MSGPASGNSRVPWPRTAGTMSRLISSRRSFSSSHRIRAPLPCTAAHPPAWLQLADGSREVTGEDSRVRPTRFGERGRREVLGLRVQGSCDLVGSPDVPPRLAKIERAHV